MMKLPAVSLVFSLALHVPLVCGMDLSLLTFRPDPGETQAVVYYMPAESVIIEDGVAQKRSQKSEQPVDNKEVTVDDGKKAFFPFFSRKRNVKVETVLRKKAVPVADEKPSSAVPESPIHVPTVENICLDDPQVKKTFFSYYDAIRDAIKQQTVYPHKAKADGRSGQVYVSFVLKRDGAIRKIVILDSSGEPMLDEAALASIRRAAPFAPFPDIVEESEITLNVPISFELH